MVEDLLEHHEIVGLSRHEVVELLGQPDSGSDHMFYQVGYMGSRPGAPFSFPKRLILRLEHETVTSVSVSD